MSKLLQTIAVALWAFIMVGCHGTSDGTEEADGGQGNSGGGSSNGGSSSGGRPSGGGLSGGSPNAGSSSGGAFAKGGASGDGGSYGECVETPSDVTPDTVTSLGFSAEQVLAAVGGSFETDLLWMTADLYATHSRSGSVTSLSIGFAEAATAVRFIDSQGGGCPGGGAACLLCQSRLEIDVDLQLVTGDGALDEHVGVTLETFTEDSATLEANWPAAELGGIFLEGVTPNAGYSLNGLHVEAGYAYGFPGSHTTIPDTWNGFVAATLRSADSNFDIFQAHGYFPKETGM